MAGKPLKLIFFAVLAAVIVIGLASTGCARREPGRYYNKEKGFSIRFPDQWEKKEGLMGTAVAALSPQQDPADDFRENVNVVVEDMPKALGLEEYFQANLANMGRLMTDYREVERGELTVYKNDARWLVYSHSMGLVETKVLAYILVRGSRGYVITCSAAPDQFPEYRAQFEEIGRSFRFE